MKNMATFVLAFVLLAFVGSTDAQTIKPRGAATVAAPAATDPTPPAAQSATPATAPVVAATTTTTTTAVATATPSVPAAPEVPAGYVTGSDMRRLSRELQRSWSQNIEVTRQNEMTRTYYTNRTNRKLNGLLIAVVVIVMLNIALLALIIIKPLRRRFLGTLICILGLGFASQAQAQTPTTPTCTIRSISNGSVVVKEQDPAAVTIAVRNCSEVKSIEVATGATDIAFTDVVQKGNVVTAKVAATSTAVTGPTLVKLTLADGTEIMSPDTTYVLILDMASAVVRKDAKAEVDALRKQITATAAAVKTAGYATQAYVADQTKSFISKDEAQAMVTAAIKPLQDRIENLEKVHPAIVAGVESNTAQIAQLTQAANGLAENQIALAHSKVKTGFWGSHALNAEVAEAAERIRQAIVEAQKAGR